MECIYVQLTLKKKELSAPEGSYAKYTGNERFKDDLVITYFKRPFIINGPLCRIHYYFCPWMYLLFVVTFFMVVLSSY